MVGGGEDDEAVFEVVVVWIKRGWGRVGHGDSIVADGPEDCEIEAKARATAGMAQDGGSFACGSG